MSTEKESNLKLREGLWKCSCDFAALIEALEPSEPTLESALGEISYLKDLERMIGKNAIMEQRYRNQAEKLIEVLHNGTTTSVRETLALMAEGEGSDSKVYMRMAKSALDILDKALLEFSHFRNRVREEVLVKKDK